MSMFSRIAALSAFSLSLAIAAPASANLIVNGSFEDPDVVSGAWKAFDASEVTGWNGSRIEIWDNYNQETAYEGNQFAELNSGPGTGTAFSIFQDIATDIGQTYDMSFAYQARNSKDEAFAFSVTPFGLDATSWSLTDHTTDGWSLFTDSFIATANSTRIMFTSVTPLTGTIGNFLDDVKVSAAVPEPGTLALFSLGLLGLVMARRRR